MFGLLLLVPVLANAQPQFAFFEPVTPPRSVQVMVHRGQATVAPENSAAAIEHCARDFCEWVELDVRLSRDGQHVIIHNATVVATTDGTGRVSELTWEELQQLDAGSWFARRFAETRLLSLSQGLAIAKGKVNLYLDCKEFDPERLVKEILAAEMQQQVIVFTFSTDRLAAFAAAAPEISRFGLIEWQNWRHLPVTVKGLGIYRHRLWSRQVVARLHRRGWKVFVWTVNDVRTMRRLMAWGVDGVISNFPDRVLDLRAG